MLQPEALYLSFIKVYSITDQSSNDNLTFSKVIYCCINFPLLSRGPRLSMTLGGYSKVGRFSFQSPGFPSGSSHGRSGHRNYIRALFSYTLKISGCHFFCQMLEWLLGVLLYQLSVCLAAFPHHPITHFIDISRLLLTLVLKSILKVLSIYYFAFTT